MIPFNIHMAGCRPQLVPDRHILHSLQTGPVSTTGSIQIYKRQTLPWNKNEMPSMSLSSYNTLATSVTYLLAINVIG